MTKPKFKIGDIVSFGPDKIQLIVLGAHYDDSKKDWFFNLIAPYDIIDATESELEPCK